MSCCAFFLLRCSFKTFIELLWFWCHMLISWCCGQASRSYFNWQAWISLYCHRVVVAFLMCECITAGVDDACVSCACLQMYVHFSLSSDVCVCESLLAAHVIFVPSLLYRIRRNTINLVLHYWQRQCFSSLLMKVRYQMWCICHPDSQWHHTHGL